jgi:hypothetical protein
MSMPWVGYIAVGFLTLAGVFEWAGGYPNLGIFLIVLSFVSLGIRIYINKKLGDRNNNH